MGCGRKFTFYFLYDILVNDCLRCLARDTAGNLSQITTAHIQLVRIEMHITMSATEIIDLRDKLTIEFRTTTRQITLTCQPYIAKTRCHPQSLLHLVPLVQIHGKGRRKAVGKTMRIGIIEQEHLHSMTLSHAQQFGVLQNNIIFFLSGNHHGTKRQQTILDLTNHILRHQRITIT